jgi:MFS family permease
MARRTITAPDTVLGMVPRRVVGTILLGTLLNPLNSSMIAVALVRLRDDFDVSLATASWLVSAFYLAAAVGQPLMGRIADLLGHRRVFCAGWVLVAITGVLAPLAPSFGWLVTARAVQALGTSAAYPAGLAMIRRSSADPQGRPPAAALGALAVAASVSAALGPVLGGALVAVAGWQAIFLVNPALALVGLPLALRHLPHDPPRVGGLRHIVHTIDWAGIVLFTGVLGGLLGLLLSLAKDPLWPLAALVVVSAVGLVWRERRASTPIVDVVVAGNPRIAAVYAQYAAVNIVFYSAFFGLPQWLEEVRGYEPAVAGLLLLPVAGFGIVATPLAARLIDRRGYRLPLLIGSTGLAIGSVGLLAATEASPLWAIVLVSSALGIPNAFNNLGLQAALYERAPAERTGAAGGLFQTFRYVGSILATALIGAFLGERATTAGLHQLALAMTIVSAGLIAVSAAARRRVMA